MAPPKKMSLQEFFQDESFGGSWADTDIDMASISVPIEKSYGYDDSVRGSNGPSGNFGPPYIVKLLNLPITANDAFIQDLFQSRFTNFIKFKIVTDPSSNILETHVIKRVAFVELESPQDVSKVLKWHDLYYKGNRRVIVEIADFNDFQNCIQFNQDHYDEIQQIQHDFIAQKQHQKQPRHMALLDELDQKSGLSHGYGGGNYHHQNRGPPPPMNQQFGGPRSPEKYHTSPRQRNRSFDSSFPPHKQHFHGLQSASGPQQQHHEEHHESIFPTQLKSKSNPFGAAKPVDTLSKQQEIEKRLINLNQTTVQTLGDDTNIDIENTIKQFHESGSPQYRNQSLYTRRPSTEKKPSIAILKRTSVDHQHPTQLQQPPPPPPPPPPQQQQQPSNFAQPTPKQSPGYTVAPQPQNQYTSNGTGKSLAQLLSERTDLVSNPPTGGKNTPPTPSIKPPIILKKKTVASPPSKNVDLTIKEGDFIKQEQAKKKLQQQETEEQQQTNQSQFPIQSPQEQYQNLKTKSESKPQSQSQQQQPKDDLNQKRPDFKKLFEHLSVNNDHTDSATPSSTTRGRGRGRGTFRARGRGRGRGGFSSYQSESHSASQAVEEPSPAQQDQSQQLKESTTTQSIPISLKDDTQPSKPSKPEESFLSSEFEEQVEESDIPRKFRKQQPQSKIINQHSQLHSVSTPSINIQLGNNENLNNNHNQSDYEEIKIRPVSADATTSSRDKFEPFPKPTVPSEIKSALPDSIINNGATSKNHQLTDQKKPDIPKESDSNLNEQTDTTTTTTTTSDNIEEPESSNVSISSRGRGRGRGRGTRGNRGYIRGYRGSRGRGGRGNSESGGFDSRHYQYIRPKTTTTSESTTTSTE
ncbi:PSP2 [Candida jiufengensis]|uniref:PSP2 n=1 Tax=Candida jiufengensis TaxID=497108 RepID=UPI0022250383|nr:PSP2 [Candida jiufengensis]KAI5952655.1 PSP2 [Candida jiufengensis]